MDSITPKEGLFNFPMPMVYVSCPECFMAFAMPMRFSNAMQRLSNSGDIENCGFYCPCGHHLRWPSDNETGVKGQVNTESPSKQASKADRAAMTKKMQELHYLEQAEARLADQKEAAEKALSENMVQGIGDLAKGAKEAFEQARKISKRNVKKDGGANA